MPAVDQWSRPADGLTLGVRPKSLRTTTRVESSMAPVGEVLEQARDGPVEPGQAGESSATVKLFWCVSQPPSVTVTNRTPASISRRASRQPWPSEFRP